MPLFLLPALACFTRLLESPAPASAFSPVRSMSPMLVSHRSGSALSYREGNTHGTMNVTMEDTGLDISSSPSLREKVAPPPVLSAPDAKREKEQFNWFKVWYPLMPVEFLSREEPTSLSLLGMDVVVYNDGVVVDESTGLPIGYGSKKERPKNSRRVEGTWRAFVDACPHRKAPLSQGRVEDDGTLMCSYHGWRWNGEGDLQDVPQAHSTELGRIKNNPKSRCNAFPTKVKNGLLWIWPDSSEDARIESELTPITQMSLEGEGIDESRVVRGSFLYRHFPISWDYLIENAIDPAHYPFSHHSSMSNRYKHVAKMDIKVTDGLSKDGFSLDYFFSMGVDSEGNEITEHFYDTFSSPGHFRVLTKLGEDGASHFLDVYVSPSKPGYCNLMLRQLLVLTEDGKVPISKREARNTQIKSLLLSTKLPKWISHIFLNKFLNEDGAFLNMQERYLHQSGEYSAVKHAEEESDNYLDAVLPISTDKGVVTFRKWLKEYAGGRTPYVGNQTMPPADIEAVFDTYHSHTKYCTTCMDAYKKFEKAKIASLATAAALCVWHPMFLGDIGTGVLVALLAGVALIAETVKGYMVKIEHKHPEND